MSRFQGTAPKIGATVTAPRRDSELTNDPAPEAPPVQHTMQLDSLSRQLIEELPKAPPRRDRSEAPRGASQTRVTDADSDAEESSAGGLSLSTVAKGAGAVLLVALLASTGAQVRNRTGAPSPAQPSTPATPMNNYERYLASIDPEELL